MKFPRIPEVVAPLGPETRAFMAEAQAHRACSHSGPGGSCECFWEVPSAPDDMTIVEGVANIIRARGTKTYGAWCVGTDEQLMELARNIVTYTSLAGK